MVTHGVRLVHVSLVGPRATFDWEMNPSDDYLRKTRFYIDYPDLDLNSVPMSTWYAIFSRSSLPASTRPAAAIVSGFRPPWKWVN